jgi:type IV secretory pathway TrbD component
MTTDMRRRNAVYRSLNRPLTILGAERKLFFFALMMGAATFNLLATLLGGILMFFTLYLAARWATTADPQMLRFTQASRLSFNTIGNTSCRIFFETVGRSPARGTTNTNRIQRSTRTRCT